MERQRARHVHLEDFKSVAECWEECTLSNTFDIDLDLHSLFELIRDLEGVDDTHELLVFQLLRWVGERVVCYRQFFDESHQPGLCRKS